MTHPERFTNYPEVLRLFRQWTREEKELYLAHHSSGNQGLMMEIDGFAPNLMITHFRREDLIFLIKQFLEEL